MAYKIRKFFEVSLEMEIDMEEMGDALETYDTILKNHLKKLDEDVCMRYTGFKRESDYLTALVEMGEGEEVHKEPPRRSLISEVKEKWGCK